MEEKLRRSFLIDPGKSDFLSQRDHLLTSELWRWAWLNGPIWPGFPKLECNSHPRSKAGFLLRLALLAFEISMSGWRQKMLKSYLSDDGGRSRHARLFSLGHLVNLANFLQTWSRFIGFHAKFQPNLQKQNSLFSRMQQKVFAMLQIWSVRIAYQLSTAISTQFKDSNTRVFRKHHVCNFLVPT